MFDVSKVTCYRCNQKGHFANKCSSPSTTNSLNVVDKSTTHSVWRSAPPSTTDNSIEGLRRTSRPTQPPDRFTPSNFRSNRSNSTSVNAVSLSDEFASSVTLNNNHDSVPGGHSSTDLTDCETDVQCHSVSANYVTVDNSSGLSNALSIINSTPDSTFNVPSEVIFVHNNIPYRTLVDTGADVSFVDQQLVRKLKLATVPINGTVQLANGSIIDRFGKLKSALPITALFMSSNSNYPAKDITHHFEIMPMNRQSFIIGCDLLRNGFLPEDRDPLDFIRDTSFPDFSRINASHCFLEPQPVSSCSPQLCEVTKLSEYSLVNEIEFNSSKLLNNNNNNNNNKYENIISSLEGIGVVPDIEHLRYLRNNYLPHCSNGLMLSLIIVL